MIDAVAASAEIRGAQIGDAAEMARLSAQVGYPLSAGRDDAPAREAARERAASRRDPAHDERAELMGLVIDATRRQGLGRSLNTSGAACTT
jgi:hypothetical protein